MAPVHIFLLRHSPTFLFFMSQISRRRETAHGKLHLTEFRFDLIVQLQHFDPRRVLSRTWPLRSGISNLGHASKAQ